MCFLRLWIIYKGTKPLCLGPLKHGETWSICHKNCIYLSTTMRTQVSYTICHCHISAHNAHQSNLRKKLFLNCPEAKYCIFNCIYWSPLGLDTYRCSQSQRHRSLEPEAAWAKASNSQNHNTLNDVDSFEHKTVKPVPMSQSRSRTKDISTEFFLFSFDYLNIEPKRIPLRFKKKHSI